MPFGSGAKRRRADAEHAEAQLVHGKRMRGAGDAPWMPQLPTPPAADTESPTPAVGASAHPESDRRHEAAPMLVTPEHSPPHCAADDADSEWDDALDPTSPYYAINRLLNQLHREREARRQRRRPMD